MLTVLKQLGNIEPLAFARRAAVVTAAVAALAATPTLALASWPATPPALPAPSGRVVNVSTEAQLQAAVSSIASGTTIVVAPGTYNLTNTLYFKGALTDI